jgi:hypothetical protein
MSAWCHKRTRAPQQLFDHLVGAALAVRAARSPGEDPAAKSFLRGSAATGRLKVAKTAKLAAEARGAKVRDATSK